MDVVTGVVPDAEAARLQALGQLNESLSAPMDQQLRRRRMMRPQYVEHLHRCSEPEMNLLDWIAMMMAA